MYRVFEALDELVTIVEEARGVPMTGSCVVPRGDVLELLDDVRDALPGEVDDAHADSDRMRQECDSYVDTTLGSMEETLTTTLRTIGRGRTSLRTGGVADFRD